YLCVQSRPVRVNSRTAPLSSRACILYPSNLISCSHSAPSGGASTSLVSCGFIQLGRPGEWSRNLLFIDLALKRRTERCHLHWCHRPRRIDMPRASWRGYLRLSLVSCPIYLSPATARTKPVRLHQVWRETPAEDGGEVSDQAGGQDVPERPVSRFTPDYVEDQ